MSQHIPDHLRQIFKVGRTVAVDDQSEVDDNDFIGMAANPLD